MAKVNVGVVGQAQLNAGMGALNDGGTGTASPVTWSFIWFAVACLFILAVYFGFGGLRGSVAS